MMDKLINSEHVASTSERKYVLCLAEYLAFFLDRAMQNGVYSIKLQTIILECFAYLSTSCILFQPLHAA
jgi:hypothetical protein